MTSRTTPVAGGGDRAETVSASLPNGLHPEATTQRPRPRGRLQVQDGHDAALGNLTIGAYIRCVNRNWQERPGGGEHRRRGAEPLLRALLAYAQAPDSPDAADRLNRELSMALAKLRAAGLTRAQVQGELYHLSRAAAGALLDAGLPGPRAAAMIEEVYHCLMFPR
jgi:hypothetical protein